MLTRREMLRTSLTAGGVALASIHEMGLSPFLIGATKNVFQGGKYLGLVEFAGEGPIPLGMPMGEGLDGRQYTDLTAAGREHAVISNDRFYIRTRASALLDVSKPWAIKVRGLVRQPTKITMADLRKTSKPAGLHLMECSGNVRDAHFGMLSVADWAGARVSEILNSVKIEKAATRVMISGFDQYPAESLTSTPGASWIFTMDDLSSSKAFFATAMNGAPLPKDHGAPVRLVLPGWYGCTCIKWVDEISFIGEDAAATSQMREFATRTTQPGEPELAREYRPALIEQAAMPVRVEKWLVDRRIKYRVNGIAWGGSRLVNGLEIRFNRDEDFVPVDDFQQTVNDPWSFWTHSWAPARRGIYFIQLRVKDGSVPARRLNAGHYVRSIDITEI